jgi:putative permease
VRFLEVIGGWINRHFSNEEAISLVVFLLLAFAVLVVFGGMLAPVLTGLVLAFLLQGLVKRLTGWGVPERAAVYLSFVFFLGALTALLLFVVPLIWQQLVALRASLPSIVERLQDMIRELPAVAPGFVTSEQVDQWLSMAAGEVGSVSGSLLNAVLTQVPSVVGVLIFLILVPISVFFFLKDKRPLLAWFQSLLPRHRPLLDRVGNEMNRQLANYVRGKFIEILIVGSVTFVVFEFMGVNYSALLGLVVGLSVLVPFVGAAVVTIPVALVAIFQFGWTWDTAWILAAYGIIQALDGNVLVPLLFSEAVDLHPITIIVAVLAFGGLWGVWGVFFAIPLATLVKAIYGAWPTVEGALDETVPDQGPDAVARDAP